MEKTDTYFTLEEAARYIGRSRMGFYNIRKRYASMGFPPAHGFRGGPQFIEKAALRDWCKKHNIPVNPRED